MRGVSSFARTFLGLFLKILVFNTVLMRVPGVFGMTPARRDLRIIRLFLGDGEQGIEVTLLIHEFFEGPLLRNLAVFQCEQAGAAAEDVLIQVVGDDDAGVSGAPALLNASFFKKKRETRASAAKYMGFAAF